MWRLKVEKMAGQIRESNFRNGNRRRKTTSCSSAKLPRSRGRQDFRHACRNRRTQRLQNGCGKTYRSLQSQVNTTYQVYNFRKAQQNECARTRAKTGESADTDKEIQEQIVLSSKSNALRRKALREDLDLTARLLKAGRALEPSETQGKEVESDKTTVNVVKDKKKSETCSKKGNGCRREQHSESRSRSHIESRKSNEASKCRNCGGAYTHKDSYPARNKNAPPVASLIILLKFVGQFHRIHWNAWRTKLAQLRMTTSTQ